MVTVQKKESLHVETQNKNFQMKLYVSFTSKNRIMDEEECLMVRGADGKEGT